MLPLLSVNRNHFRHSIDCEERLGEGVLYSENRGQCSFPSTLPLGGCRWSLVWPLSRGQEVPLAFLEPSPASLPRHLLLWPLFRGVHQEWLSLHEV